MIKSIFNKPYKTDKELIENKNVSDWIVEQLENNGEITIQEVLEYQNKEPTYKNLNFSRIQILSKSVKGKIEKDGKTLSCDDGRYFIIVNDIDAEREAIRRKNNTLGYLNTAKRAFNNLKESNPEYIDNILQASHEILARALDFKLKFTKQLKE